MLAPGFDAARGVTYVGLSRLMPFTARQLGGLHVTGLREW